MSLKEKAVKGIAWSATEKWGTQAVTFLVFLVLARLLEPEAFGLVAMASVFTAFIQVFLDQGLGEALVQRTDLELEHLDTAFWANMLTGGMVTVSGILLSGLVADLYDEPQLTPVVAWLSLSFLLVALSSTQRAILRRRLDFKSLAVRTLTARVGGGIIGVAVALLGFGVWSLVAQNLANGLIGVIVLWRVSDWRPGFGLSRKHFRELFTFGLNIVGSRTLAFFSTRLDDFLIGYFLGPIALGYYTIAYRLLRVMNDLLVSMTSAVAFPAFSRLQTEPERLRRAFYQAVQLTSLVAFPAFLGVAVLAPELVVTLFGARWEPSIPVMQILVLAGLVQSVLQLNGNLLIALGKPSVFFGLKLLNTIAYAVGFTLVVRWGIVAVAAVFALIRWGLAPLDLWVTYRLARLDLGAYFRQSMASLAGSLAMVAAVVGAKYALAGWMGKHEQLVVYVLVGILVYLLVVRLVTPSLSQQMLALARLALPRRFLRGLGAAEEKAGSGPHSQQE